jgi:hypothetical protein
MWIHDKYCRNRDSSDQILTPYTTSSNGAQGSISLIRAVKPTSDVTANVIAVANTPKRISEPRFCRQGLHDSPHRIPLVTVKVRLSGAGHQGAYCEGEQHIWGDWSASLSGHFTHFLYLPSQKIFSTHGKGGWGPQRGVWTLGKRQNVCCHCPESIPESSKIAVFLCTWLLNLFGFVHNSLLI